MCLGLWANFLTVSWHIIGAFYVIDAKQFKPLLSLSGLTTCSVDSPTQVVPLSKLRIGVPPGVPDAIRCAYGCTGFRGCMKFNYRRPMNNLMDTGQCEFYTSPPMNCTITDNHCHHYQEVDNPSQCILTANYTVYTCEGGTLDITCPGDSRIVIQQANYGRLSSSFCCDETTSDSCTDTDCGVTASLSIAKQTCDAKSSCILTASPSFFGDDPCPGIYKYLLVQYYCA